MIRQRLGRAVPWVAVALLALTACSAPLPPLIAGRQPAPAPPELTPVARSMPAAMEYNLGETTVTQARFPEDSRFRNMPVRLNGVIAAPQQGEGPFPVVVILHGTHPGCPEIDHVDRWPCDVADERPNYQGFGYLVERLAADGYVALSININAENTFGFGEPTPGERLGQIVDKHLAALAAASAGGENRFGIDLDGKADMRRLAFAGHSRGGEMAYTLTQNLEAAGDAAAGGFGPPAGILMIAPSPVFADPANGSPVPLGIILPLCDGDVTNQEGQHFYEGARLAAGQRAWVTSTFVEAANHNFFNTTLGDDPFGRPGRPDCATLLKPEAQQAFLGDYAVDFFAALFGNAPAATAARARPRHGRGGACAGRVVRHAGPRRGAAARRGADADFHAAGRRRADDEPAGGRGHGRGRDDVLLRRGLLHAPRAARHRAVPAGHRSDPGRSCAGGGQLGKARRRAALRDPGGRRRLEPRRGDHAAGRGRSAFGAQRPGPAPGVLDPLDGRGGKDGHGERAAGRARPAFPGRRGGGGRDVRPDVHRPVAADDRAHFDVRAARPGQDGYPGDRARVRPDAKRVAVRGRRGVGGASRPARIRSATFMGPVEYLVVEFPGNQFKGEIVPALRELTDSGVIRIIDLLIIKKDADGNCATFELTNLPDDEAAPFEQLEGEVDDLLNDEDGQLMAAALEPNSSAGVLVFENVWATRLRDAIVNAGGRLVDNARIPAPVVDAALAALD